MRGMSFNRLSPIPTSDTLVRRGSAQPRDAVGAGPVHGEARARLAAVSCVVHAGETANWFCS